MKIIEKPIGFLKEVRTELGKVSWSTRQELIDSTILVFVITGILTLFIAAIDISLSKLLSLVIK
jgi:preprotein translocase subunit SecE